MTGATGPKVSSWAMRISVVTPVRIVAGKKSPSSLPNCTTSAPLLRASSTCSAMRHKVTSLRTGPMSVS